jgi:hypothetical protein
MLNYNKEILIFDDLDLTYATDELYYIVTSGNFPWFLNDGTVYDPDLYDKTKFAECDVMTHAFIFNRKKNSEHDHLPINMLEIFSKRSGIEFKRILRAQTNMVMQKILDKPTPPHVDTPDKHYVLLVYLNDSDGDTILFNENMEEIKRITPKRGRFVIFDGSIKHSVIPPINTKHRIVFNYNLEL